MKISEILSTSVRPFASLEIVPPLKGMTKAELLDSIRPFMEFNPPFMNITSHRDEVEYVPRPDGGFDRRQIRRRISETAVCAAIQSEFDVEVVPHVICGGATAEQIEFLLQDFKFLGVDNILALRGDSLVGEKRFTPIPGGYSHASELVKAVSDFEKTNDKRFCVGVGGYPEKHFEAPNIEQDIAHLKEKVDAGADYIVTQMFFDNSVFYRFVDLCRQAGITIPIIPGLKPLSTARQVSLLPKSFSIDIPEPLASEIQSHAEDKAACYEIGREWCLSQCRDLIAHGVKAIHFYTMGRPDNVLDILRECF
jgi:methylenetetrahydrofolate reductase (NADPH)